MKILAEEIRDEICRRFENGECCTVIAKELNVNVNTVYRYTDGLVVTHDPKEKWIDFETRNWFAREWANIYPGDEVRNRRMRR